MHISATRKELGAMPWMALNINVKRKKSILSRILNKFKHLQGQSSASLNSKNSLLSEDSLEIYDATFLIMIYGSV